jgi:hypothetical protein
MERFVCPQCKGEFYLNTGCSCCLPPPGPYYCPECGAVLNRKMPTYFYSSSWDDE